jgi:hypothetical protein
VRVGRLRLGRARALDGPCSVVQAFFEIAKTPEIERQPDLLLSVLSDEVIDAGIAHAEASRCAAAATTSQQLVSFRIVQRHVSA